MTVSYYTGLQRVRTDVKSYQGIKVAVHKSNEEQEILIKIIFLKFIYQIVVHPFHNSPY